MKWKNKILNAVIWLLRMDRPKVHVYQYQMKFDNREMPIGKIKTDFQRGLLKYIEHNKLVDLTMKERKDSQTITFKISINGKK